MCRAPHRACRVVEAPLASRRTAPPRARRAIGPSTGRGRRRRSRRGLAMLSSCSRCRRSHETVNARTRSCVGAPRSAILAPFPTRPNRCAFLAAPRSCSVCSRRSPRSSLPCSPIRRRSRPRSPSRSCLRSRARASGSSPPRRTSPGRCASTTKAKRRCESPPTRDCFASQSSSPKAPSRPRRSRR